VNLREYNPYLTKERIKQFVDSSTNIEREEYEDTSLDEKRELGISKEYLGAG
jgi:hypothetical protein